MGQREKMKISLSILVDDSLEVLQMGHFNGSVRSKKPSEEDMTYYSGVCVVGGSRYDQKRFREAFYRKALTVFPKPLFMGMRGDLTRFESNGFYEIDLRQIELVD